MGISEFIKPKSIVLIGASRQIRSVGGVLVKNLKKSDVNLYLVNPNASEIQGIKCYSSVLDIKKKIDLAVIVTPAKIIPKILLQLGKVQIFNAIILSSGFSEVGNHKLEDELVKSSKIAGVSFLGPNCLGVITPEINISFYEGTVNAGSFALISQSGAIGVGVLDYLAEKGNGLSCFISIGNMKGLGFSDFFTYFNKDKRTKVLSFYVESLRDGYHFVKTRQLLKKPVIVLKSARTELSSETALSHTGSLSQDYSVYKPVFKQHNIALVDDVKELLSSSLASSEQELPFNETVFIITNAGGLGVLSVDQIEEEGLKLYKSNVSNPLDLLGDAGYKDYLKIFKKVLKLNNIGCFLVILTPQSMSEPLKVSEEIVKFSKKTKIPVYASFFGGESVKKAVKFLELNHVPTFFEPMSAVKVIKELLFLRQ